MKTYDSISAYIEACPAEHRTLLEQLRAIIQKNVPTAQETISYGIPTFKLRGNLIHFGLAKKHIGLYPGAAAVEAFKEALGAYKTSKGAIQLPLEEELPIGLIEDILRFSVAAQTKSA
ncbi:hypothetical protein GCM10011387_12190 [Pedobacter quisquiliarum]|uniref:YdhG-like domain-containing protein n=1 Tax=Pedobacter quisquiliarum TaxID=1834438 RepID=A0A916U5G3_9SPHI|nr:DUF1801 domain-containing protein [Pedobacter quisquiliarum]GGC60129.1 hypothetical protein GCM10011387_12190 [Pedobacter quisquiliarum]